MLDRLFYLLARCFRKELGPKGRSRIGMQAGRLAGRPTDWQVGRQAGRTTGKQVDRQAERLASGQTGRQSDRRAGRGGTQALGPKAEHSQTGKQAGHLTSHFVRISQGSGLMIRQHGFK